MPAVHDMSLWGLVSQATWVVQLVMLALLLASILSWVIIFQRRQVMGFAKKGLDAFEDQFWSGMDLAKLYRQISGQTKKACGVERVFLSGFKEYHRLNQLPGMDPNAITVGTQRAMRVAIAKEEEMLQTHLSFLATVGSTSPYVGLFGTVWGIMHAFMGLANVQQATLSTVAPGIAEALIATAIGLFAAIPAVIAYNRFAAKSETLLSRYDTFAEEFQAILHRKVHSFDD